MNMPIGGFSGKDHFNGKDKIPWEMDAVSFVMRRHLSKGNEKKRKRKRCRQHVSIVFFMVINKCRP